MSNRITRGILAVVGFGFVGYGLIATLTQVRWVDLVRLIRWALLSWLTSDLILMPAALALGVLLMPRVPGRYRSPLRAGLLGLSCLMIITGIAVGAARYRRNPTVIPTDPLVGWGIGLALLLIAIGVWELINGLTDRPGRDRHRP